MSLILTGCYLIVRLLMMEQENTKTKFRLFLTSCGGILLGVGMSLMVLLPTAAVIFGVSARMDSGGSVLSRIVDGLSLYPGIYYETLAGPFLLQQSAGDGSAQCIRIRRLH